MSQPVDAHDELRGLLELVCSEQITAPQLRRLERIVLDNPAERDFFWQYQQMHAALLWRYRGDAPHGDAPGGAQADGEEASAAPPADQPSSVLGFLGALGVDNLLHQQSVQVGLLSVLIALTFWGLLGIALRGDRGPAARSLAAHVEVIEDCRWAEPKSAPLPGEGLEAGKTLFLEAGQVEIAFGSGTRARLEGPAQFSIRSANSGFLRLGKLAARVPREAVGFTIDTPSATIVDLGTEFGVEVGLDGETDVQVFEGAVEFSRSASSSPEQGTRAPLVRRLAKGHAARTAGGGAAITVADFAPDRFARPGRARGGDRRVPVDLSQAVATQSSNVHPSYPPHNAIDGDPKTFMHSAAGDTNCWWQVDLGAPHAIVAVVLHNEPEARGWLRDITIKVLASDGRTVVAESPQLNPKNVFGGGERDFDDGPLKLTFNLVASQGKPALGQFVRVQRQPAVIDDEQIITKRGRDPYWLTYCKNGLLIAEVDVYESGETAATTVRDRPAAPEPP